MSELLKRKEAAAYLHIGVDTIDELTKKGELACTRVGLQRMYLRPELDAFIVRNTSKAEEAK